MNKNSISVHMRSITIKPNILKGVQYESWFQNIGNQVYSIIIDTT